MNRAERRAWNYLSSYKDARLAGSTHATCLRDLLTLREMVQPLIDDVALDMRRAGYTWREVGEALGVSQQYAQKRYSS